MKQRVIACGQPAAGDDGVGFVVLGALERENLPAEVELCRARDTVALLPLLERAERILIVDAALGPEPGEMRVLDPCQVDASAPSGVSSHGIGVRQAVELARALNPAEVAPEIAILAVGIARPTEYALGLSPRVARAVPSAVALALAWLLPSCEELGARGSSEEHHARD
jgi:hydrogenase maturation protease